MLPDVDAPMLVNCLALARSFFVSSMVSKERVAALARARDIGGLRKVQVIAFGAGGVRPQDESEAEPV